MKELNKNKEKKITQISMNINQQEYWFIQVQQMQDIIIVLLKKETKNPKITGNGLNLMIQA